MRHVVVFVLATLGSFLGTTHACSCMPAHPQDHFCNSDFVILATVKREFPTDSYIKTYKVKIRKEFKMSDKAKIALKHGRIQTYTQDSFCGVSLELRKTYVLTGRVSELKPFINLCGFNKLWSTVNHRQRKGFRLLYGRGCDCTLQTRLCRLPSCRSKTDGCDWTWSQCQRDYGICLRNQNGKCKWTRSLAMKQCLYGEDHGKFFPRLTSTRQPDPFLLPKEEELTTRSNHEGNKNQDTYFRYNEIAE